MAPFTVAQQIISDIAQEAHPEKRVSRSRKAAVIRSLPKNCMALAKAKIRHHDLGDPFVQLRTELE
jgi:hypothetical protein